MTDFRAIVLAAGVGSRLRPMTDAIPKCLVPIDGRPILGWQLDALLSAGAAEVTVVAGYRAPQVIEFCHSYGNRVRVVVNVDYATTNNMYSFRMGASALNGTDVVVCNGDVVFDPSIVQRLVEPERGDLIAVEPGRYVEESMKVVVDAGGRIVELNKRIDARRAFGVSIDVYRFGPDTVDAILRAADRLIDEGDQRNLWTEVAIDAVLATSDVRPHDIEQRRWVEIDNFDDLAEANRLFAAAVGRAQ
jgi:choline kinase